MGTKKLTEEDEREIITLYKQGASLRYIAADFNIAPTTVSRTLRRRGVKTRRPGAPRMPGAHTRPVAEQRMATIKQRDKEARLQSQYGLSLNDVAKILDKQHGRCPICGKRLPRKYGPQMAIDHDHKTGKVRGILCHRCNQGLGFFRDNTQLLTNAIKYLTRDQDQQPRLFILPSSGISPQGAQGVVRLTRTGQYVITVPRDMSGALRLKEGDVHQWKIDTCNGDKSFCLCLILRRAK